MVLTGWKTDAALSACCHVDTYVGGDTTHYYVCESCGLACDLWDGEPTDNELANRYGVEGGIGYDPLLEQLEEARRLK